MKAMSNGRIVVTQWLHKYQNR